MATGFRIENTPFGPSPSLPGPVTTLTAKIGIPPAISRSLASAIMTPRVANRGRGKSLGKKKVYALSDGVGLSDDAFTSPVPDVPPIQVGMTRARAEAAADPPYALIAAGVGAIAIGALLFMKLR